MIKQIVSILILVLLGITSGQGQETITPEERYLEASIEQHQLDRKRWADLTEGIDYTEKQRRQPAPREQQNENTRNESTSMFGEGTGAAIARFLLITLGAIAIALLVKSMLGYGKVKNKKINRKTEEGIDIQKIEENIHEADLDDYIQQAKANGDYNLAIRLYYLAILKELSLQKDIKWKVDKTNNEYLREMRQHDMFTEFRQLTLIFERSWYGNRPPDAETFNRIEPGFQHFLNRLPVVKNPVAP